MPDNSFKKLTDKIFGKEPEIEAPEYDELDYYIDSYDSMMEDEETIEVEVGKTEPQSNLEKMLNDGVGSEKLYSAFYSYKPRAKRTEYSFSAKILAKLLIEEFGIIIKAPGENILKTYQLDSKTNTFYKITNRDIMNLCVKDMGDDAIIDTDNVAKTVKAITKTKNVDYDLIKFKNGVLNWKTWEFVPKYEKPVLPYLSLDYEFNPHAKPSDLLMNFLMSSFEMGTEEETRTNIRGVLELIGYYLTPGNPKQIIVILVGPGGTGKSVLLSIISSVFGDKPNVCEVSLQDLAGKGSQFAKAPLIDAQINIINDMSTESINDVGGIKQITGNTSTPVEVKFEGIETLEPQEIPKTWGSANRFPFMNGDEALYERIILINMNHKFRGKSNQIESLEEKIKNNETDMEWLIYHSLYAFYRMECEGKRFIHRRSLDETKSEVTKYQDPLSYCISKLFVGYEFEENEEDGKIFDYGGEPILNTELNKVVCALAEEEGLDLRLNNNGQISGKRLTSAVRRALDIENKYYSPISTTVKMKSGRYYKGLIKSDFYNTILAKVMKDEE